MQDPKASEKTYRASKVALVALNSLVYAQCDGHAMATTTPQDSI